MDLITKRTISLAKFECSSEFRRILVTTRIYIYIYKSDPRVHIRAYSYSLADVLDGRPFRVVPSLRRIFQQLDARRTVRQVYPGCRVVSNEPRRASPTASFPHCRLLFRVTSLETVCIRIHLLLLLTPCVVIRSFSPRIRGTTTRSLPQERVTRFLVRYRLWEGRALNVATWRQLIESTAYILLEGEEKLSFA